MNDLPVTRRRKFAAVFVPALAAGVTSTILTLAVVVLAGAMLGGCGSPPAAPQKDPWTVRYDAAMAYMKTHPAPPVPGMYAGIVIAGDPPGSRAWILEVAAQNGDWVEAQCGAKGDLGGCTWREPASLLGAYVYVRSEGCCQTADADRRSDVRVIRYRALALSGMDGP